MDFMDERLRRKLVKRRGRLHVFEPLAPERTAVIVIDLTQPILDGMPDKSGLVRSVNALTAAARRAGAVVAWVVPLPPSRWKSAAQARLLFGEQRMRELELELRESRTTAREMTVADGDWHLAKLGHSAFFPGNCMLPARLEEAGIDTVIFAGVLTDVCVAASAKDAHESGHRTIVCSDAVAANEPQLHAMALRTLVRVYADVRPSGALVALFAAGIQ